MKYKFIFLLICVCFSACHTPYPSGSNHNHNSWDKVERQGIIKVGVKKNSPPFSKQEQDGSFWGFDIDIARSIAERLNKKIVFVPLSAKQRIPAILNRKVDIVLSSMSMSQNRDEVIDFSMPYFEVQKGVLSLKDNPVTSLMDLSDKNVAFISGSQSYHMLIEHDLESRPFFYKDYRAALNDLKSKKVNAFLSDYLILLGLKNQYKDQKNLYLSEPLDARDLYAVAMLENQSDLRDAINRAIMYLWTEGIWQDHFETWFAEGSLYYHETKFHIDVYSK